MPVQQQTAIVLGSCSWTCLCMCVYCWLTGTAYIHGIKHATGNFIILMDADLSHHVSVFVFLAPTH